MDHCQGVHYALTRRCGWEVDIALSGAGLSFLLAGSSVPVLKIFLWSEWGGGRGILKLSSQRISLPPNHVTKLVRELNDNFIGRRFAVNFVPQHSLRTHVTNQRSSGASNIGNQTKSYNSAMCSTVAFRVEHLINIDVFNQVCQLLS